MKKFLVLFTALFLLIPFSAFSAEQEADKEREDFLSQFDWVTGPGKAKIGNYAEINVPQGFRFTGKDGSYKILEASGNFPSGDELGLMINDKEDWWVLFEFSDIGYVKDDDKEELDADDMLKKMTKGNEAANDERERMGIPALHVTGWHTPPHYDETSNNLEWGILYESAGETGINYNTRLRGRHGVMEVTLICDDAQMAGAMPEFRGLLGDYSYVSGEKYAEYQEGDKVAKYGLAALVLGGAAVGAAKLGLFAWLALMLKKAGKAIVLVIVAIGAFFKKVFTSIFGRREREEVDTY